MRTHNAIRGHVRPLVHSPITIKLASVIPYIYDAAELWESLYMHACVGGGNVDGGCSPLPTRPQRDYDPASLVQFLHDFLKH